MLVREVPSVSLSYAHQMQTTFAVHRNHAQMQTTFNAYTAIIIANPTMLGFSSAFTHFKGHKNRIRIEANAMSRMVARYRNMSIVVT